MTLSRLGMPAKAMVRAWLTRVPWAGKFSMLNRPAGFSTLVRVYEAFAAHTAKMFAVGRKPTWAIGR